MLNRLRNDESSTGTGRAFLLCVGAIVLIQIVIGNPATSDRQLAAAPEADDKATTAARLEEEVAALRPAVPGKLRMEMRSRLDEKETDGVSFIPTMKTEEWNVAETAIIICDMWNGHYCLSCAERVDAMAPEMNRVVSAARAHGVAIIHAPSGCMDVYAATPQRKRVERAPKVEPPVKIESWCYLDPKTEPEMPVDFAKSPCDDPVVGKAVKVFSKQHDAIAITGYDGVSDSGEEIFSYFRQLGIKNVVLMGVHTNMCVLGRPFGIRQMKRLGFNVVLARDLTDAMYDPREYPYVSHTRGTEMIIEHIEKYWCPSILGADLTQVISGSSNPDLPAAGRRKAAETAAK